jgi:hypothetical protein
MNEKKLLINIINSDPTTWQEAASDALGQIFDAADQSPSSLTDLRCILEGFIDNCFEADEEDTRAETQIRWTMLGATAINMSAVRRETLRKGVRKEILRKGYVLPILISKQRDYGHENIRRFGRKGLIVRLHDKVARLENLLDNGNEPSNESIKDTLLDIVGYSAIGIMWEEDHFLLPLGPKD